MADTLPDLEEWTDQAREWLAERLEPKTTADKAAEAPKPVWGEGEFSVSVFHSLTYEEERALLDETMAYHREKYAAGYAALTWAAEHGGQGLPLAYERAFHREEGKFKLPDGHETFSVTVGLMAPAIRAFGTQAQQDEFLRPFLSTDVLCCQLFSEPGAGSDLANLSCKADRDGDEWVLNGQKVWSSGAQFSEWGLCITRHDASAPKHKGMTAFLVPMDAPGVEIRQIKQMSGGTSFNEVFLSDVRVPDAHRLGDVGEGWKVALTVLGFERGASSGGGHGKVGANWHDVRMLAEHLGSQHDPVLRQDLAKLYTTHKLMQWNNQRAIDKLKAGETPGPEGSIGKLVWADSLKQIGEFAAAALGARITADSGEWGTFDWNEHLLGAPGYRIAGGSDEVQRNIIGERVLGLPGEPRVDKGLPWNEIAR
ncbi:MAG: acyl-CoA dehydrogenase family protein [Actinomycetota bacterium]